MVGAIFTATQPTSSMGRNLSHARNISFVTIPLDLISILASHSMIMASTSLELPLEKNMNDTQEMVNLVGCLVCPPMVVCKQGVDHGDA